MKLKTVRKLKYPCNIYVALFSTEGSISRKDSDWLLEDIEEVLTPVKREAIRMAWNPSRIDNLPEEIPGFKIVSIRSELGRSYTILEQARLLKLERESNELVENVTGEELENNQVILKVTCKKCYNYTIIKLDSEKYRKWLMCIPTKHIFKRRRKNNYRNLPDGLYCSECRGFFTKG